MIKTHDLDKSKVFSQGMPCITYAQHFQLSLSNIHHMIQLLTTNLRNEQVESWIMGWLIRCLNGA